MKIMDFQTADKFELYGKMSGFFLSYALFTTILYVILSLLDKLPSSWNIIHIILLTFIITIFGGTLKRWLQN